MEGVRKFKNLGFFKKGRPIFKCLLNDGESCTNRTNNSQAGSQVHALILLLARNKVKVLTQFLKNNHTDLRSFALICG